MSADNIRITLPDGSVRDVARGTTGADVAASIGAGLAKAAVGVKVDGELRDLSAPLDADCRLEIVTEPRKNQEASADALYLLRHSAAHVMAEAIQRIVPGAQLVYGPPLDTGFYYDIAFPDDRPLREGDFEAIEAEMAKIVKEDRPFTRYELPLDLGFQKLGGERSRFKEDNAKRAAEAGSRRLSWYVTGRVQYVQAPDGRQAYSVSSDPALLFKKDPSSDPRWIVFNKSDLTVLHGDLVPPPADSAASGRGHWEDLCRGPHLPSTGRIGAFKIMSLASSYWHGDENSDRLTRVYATAFYRQQDLDDHLARLEEAKARDHRVLGKKLQLFHIDDAVGQGLILWTPNGSIVRKELQDFIGAELRKQGYFDVFCPHIGKLGLYKTSGHFPYYAESQYVPVLDREFIRHVADDGCSCAQLSNMLREGDVEGYLLKPMNCPHHIKIYSSQPRSYRDLPVRLSEFGTVYRWEQSGELAGMLRVRSFTVDDAHLFVREDQIGAEVRGCLSLVKLAFETIGLHDFRVRVGLRDPDSSKYVGDAANWDKAEAACRDAAATLGVRVSEEPGEAAFYGPKIDFIVRDVIGREWQLGTVQVDYNLPQRFDLTYTGSDNQPHRPVMIHRAPFGSMERFVGFLIEHFAGAFPVWLAPEQVRVLPISEKTNDYAHRVLGALKDAGVRAALDDANDRVQSKIRHAAEMKIPYMLVVGPRDEEQGTVSVRARGHQKDLGAMPIDEFVEGVAVEARRRLAWEADGTIAAAMAPAGV